MWNNWIELMTRIQTHLQTLLQSWLNCFVNKGIMDENKGPGFYKIIKSRKYSIKQESASKVNTHTHKKNTKTVENVYFTQNPYLLKNIWHTQ